MKRLIGFYSVNNSLGYERYTFDTIYDKPKEILKMLNKLPEDEVCIYNMSLNKNGSGMESDISDFIEDYNDEVLDGGWWSVLMEFPE